MNAKLDKLNEMSKRLSTQDGVNGDLLSLFGRFGLGQLLRRLCLEKQCGVSAVQLILSLCLFRINGESIHSLYNKQFYNLPETGKNCYYRMLNRSTMAWKAGIHANYTLTDSWFTCESLIAAVRELGKGCVHFVGLAKMGNTRYKVHGRQHNALELVTLHERDNIKTCRKYKCRYISLKATYGQQPVRIFLIKYGRNSNWNILITSDLSLDFIKCFELYQIRWNIEVLIKENKEHLGLGNYQGTDFNGQIADCTLCFLTYIVVSLLSRHVSSSRWHFQLWADAFLQSGVIGIFLVSFLRILRLQLFSGKTTVSLLSLFTMDREIYWYGGAPIKETDQ